MTILLCSLSHVSPWDLMDCIPELLCPWDFWTRILEWVTVPLQEIFPIQGSNPRPLHWQVGFFTADPPGYNWKYKSDTSYSKNYREFQGSNKQSIQPSVSPFWAEDIVWLFTVICSWSHPCKREAVESCWLLARIHTWILLPVRKEDSSVFQLPLSCLLLSFLVRLSLWRLCFLGLGPLILAYLFWYIPTPNYYRRKRN